MLANVVTFIKALLASALTNEAVMSGLKSGISSLAFSALDYLGKTFFPKVAPAQAPLAAAILFDPDTTTFVQNALNTYFAKAADFIALKVDGDYGPKTQAAVAKFQALFPDLLKVDGWAGEKTKAVLTALLQGFTVAPSPKS